MAGAGASAQKKTRRTTVKTGCRTCKARKVKCDEGRPACRRCVSTGRNCEGYGIWGGGGNFCTEQQPPTGQKFNGVALRPENGLNVWKPDFREMQYYDWFKCRLSKKISGAFVLSFWNRLVFQASVSEPAVMHALLTLSSIHKAGFIDDRGRILASPDQEQFTLQQYGKAISYLQPALSANDKASARVALIACVIFVGLEFLRGHFKAAEMHLRSGLKVLEEWQQPSASGADNIVTLGTFENAVDEAIASALHRLQFSVELFKQTWQHSCATLQIRGPLIRGPTIPSLNVGFTWLEQLLNKILHLTEEVRQQQQSGAAKFFPKLLRDQQTLQSDLSRWNRAYEASKCYLWGHGPLLMSTDEGSRYSKRPLPDSTTACELMYEYHTMSSIMADVCLCPGDESVFDLYTEKFVSIINRSAYMREMRLTDRAPPQRTYSFDMSRSFVDIGWIPPLYYTALKCRIHRVRYQAIRLIGSAAHREGIWDSFIMSCVARKVMELEEGDFYKDIDLNDDFELWQSPLPQDLAVAPVPLSRRIQEVKIETSNDMTKTVQLLYRREWGRGDWEHVEVDIYAHETDWYYMSEETTHEWRDGPLWTEYRSEGGFDNQHRN